MGLGGRFQGLSQLYLEYSSLGATNPIVPFVPVVFGSSIISGQFAKPIKPPKTPLALLGFALYFPSCCATSSSGLEIPFVPFFLPGCAFPYCSTGQQRAPDQVKALSQSPFVPYPTTSTSA